MMTEPLQREQDPSNDVPEMLVKVPLHPNYFFGFRITNPQILQKAKEFQDSTAKKNPFFKRAWVDLARLHVTFDVFHLPGEEDVKAVSKLLDKWAVERRAQVFKDPIQITLQNLELWNKRTVVAKLQEDKNCDNLCNLAEELKQLVSDAGYLNPNLKPLRNFNPHVTLLKLTQDRSLFRQKKGLQDIAKEFVKPPIDFGTQDVETIQLLEMGSKDIEGCYYCAHEIVTDSLKPVPPRKPRASQVVNWRAEPRPTFN